MSLEGGQRFFDAVLGRTFARRNLAHPNLTAACAAAERVFAVARHFVEFHAEQFEQFARSGEAAVVASEIARVVEGDFVMREFVLDGEFAFFDQLEQCHGVMLDFKLPAKLRILVFEGVERMRVGGDDLLELRFAKRRHVLLDELLEQTFFPHAAHVVACIGFVLVEDAEVQACLMEEARDHLRIWDDALIERSGIANEPQIFHRLFGRVLDGELHLLCPASAQTFAFAHPVAVGGERLQRVLYAAVNFVTVNQHAAADVHDIRHRFVADRTHADTGVTRCARPNRLRGDNALRKRNQQSVGVRTEGRFLEEITLVHLQCRRGERTSIEICRADILTAVALHAGVGVHDARPGEIGDDLRARVELLPFDNLERNGRIELTARILFGETQIDGRHEKVRVLAAREIRDDEHHPAETDPPRHMYARLRRAEDGIEKTSDGHERVGVFGEAVGLTHQVRADVHDDEHADDERIARLPARLDFGMQQHVFAEGERLVFDDEAAHKKDRDGDEQKTAHHVGDEVVGVDESRGRVGQMFAAVDQIKT